MKRIKRPFAVTAFSLITGLGILMIYGERVLLFTVLVCAVICIITAVLQKSEARVWLLICALLVASSLLFKMAISVPESLSALPDGDVKITGTIVCVPEDTGKKLSYFIISDVSINDIETDGKIKVYAPCGNEVLPGDRISFIASSLNEKENTGLFHFHTLSERVYLNAFTYDDVTIIERPEEKSIYTKILLLRKAVSDKYKDNLSDEASALANALVTGDRSSLPTEISYAMGICGASHIFAVSGMHLSLWTGIFFIIFKKRSRVSFIPNMTAILFVIFYCAFTGFSPSVLRSGIMLITLFISKILRRHSDAINTLGLSGTVLLIHNPFLAGNISFLLSFTATFAMLFFNSFIFTEGANLKGRFVFLKKRALSIKSSLLVSLSVLFATLPLSALFFGYVSLLSPLSSLLLTPVAEGIMITSGIGTLIPSGNAVSHFIFRITDYLCHILTEILYTLQKLDFMVAAADIKLILPFFVVTVFTAGLIVKYIRNNKLAIKCILLGMILMTIAVIGDYHTHIGETKIFIPQTGNSTIFAVTRDNSKAFIYGSGGSFSTCRDVISYIQRSGIFFTERFFIPRYNKTENLNTLYLSESIPTKKLVHLYEEGSEMSYKESLWKDTELYSLTSSDFSAAVLNVEDVKIVICSLPTSDFSEEDSVFLDADILICRGSIPAALNKENFGKIIVMTNDKQNDNDKNVFYTADKNTEIIIKGDSYAIYR